MLHTYIKSQKLHCAAANGQWWGWRAVEGGVELLQACSVLCGLGRGCRHGGVRWSAKDGVRRRRALKHAPDLAQPGKGRRAVAALLPLLRRLRRVPAEMPSWRSTAAGPAARASSFPSPWSPRSLQGVGLSFAHIPELRCLLSASVAASLSRTTSATHPSHLTGRQSSHRAAGSVRGVARPHRGTNACHCCHRRRRPRTARTWQHGSADQQGKGKSEDVGGCR